MRRPPESSSPPMRASLNQPRGTPSDMRSCTSTPQLGHLTPFQQNQLALLLRQTHPHHRMGQIHVLLLNVVKALLRAIVVLAAWLSLVIGLILRLSAHAFVNLYKACTTITLLPSLQWCDSEPGRELLNPPPNAAASADDEIFTPSFAERERLPLLHHCLGRSNVSPSPTLPRQARLSPPWPPPTTQSSAPSTTLDGAAAWLHTESSDFDADCPPNLHVPPVSVSSARPPPEAARLWLNSDVALRDLRHL